MCERLKTVLTDASIRLGRPSFLWDLTPLRNASGNEIRHWTLRGLRVLDLSCGNGCYIRRLARRASSFAELIFIAASAGVSRGHSTRTGKRRTTALCSDSFDAVTMIEKVLGTHGERCESADGVFSRIEAGGLLVLFLRTSCTPVESHLATLAAGDGPNSPGFLAPGISGTDAFVTPGFTLAASFSLTKVRAFGPGRSGIFSPVGFVSSAFQRVVPASHAKA